MKLGTRIAIIVAVTTSVLALLVAGSWGGHLELLDPQGPVAAQQRDLMLWVIGLMLLVVVPVFVLTASIAWRYRATNRRARYEPEWDHNRRFELVWWGVPAAIIVVLAGITWVTSHTLDPFRPLASREPTLDIQVVALQYKWLFIYPDSGVATVNYAEIPVGRPVRFSITSDAPMNSFWVPQLGGQIYAMSGMATQLHLQADRAGSYAGQSANLSGTQFADMRFKVRAVTADQYEAWESAAKTEPWALTPPEFERLRQPGVSPEQTYASSPPELFAQLSSSEHMGMKHPEHSND